MAKSKSYYKKKANKPKWKKSKYRSANALTVTRIAPVICPQRLYVRLVYAQSIFNKFMPGGTSLNFNWLANGLNPFGDETATAIYGDATGNTSVPPLNQLYNGLQGYSKFYQSCYILDNKIDLRINTQPDLDLVPNQISPAPNIQATLTAFPYRANQVTPQILSIGPITIQMLMQQPKAITKIITGQGGRNSVRITQRRTGKSMVGCKDYLDDVNRECRLQTNLNAPSLRNPTENSQWFWFLKVVNQTPGNAGSFTFNMEVKLTAMFCLLDVNFLGAPSSTFAPPVFEP